VQARRSETVGNAERRLVGIVQQYAHRDNRLAVRQIQSLRKRLDLSGIRGAGHQ